MAQLAVILVAVLVFSAIGLLIFLPLRWFALQRASPEQKRRASRQDILLAIAVVAALLPLAWLMEAGNRYAAVVWSCAILIASVAVGIVLSKQRQQVRNGSGDDV